MPAAMSLNNEIWRPRRTTLAANLRHLRTLLDRRTPRFDGVSELLRVAQLLCPDSTGIESMQAVIRLALAHRHSIWEKPAPLLYGLTPDSKNLGLRERRRLAFEASNETSLNTFRTRREPEMIDDLTEALIELVINDGSRRAPKIILRPLTDPELEAARPLSNAIMAELQTAFTKGLMQAVEGNRVPFLVGLAVKVFQGSETPLEKTEKLFRWTIDEGEDDTIRREGIVELLGLSQFRDLSLNQRRDRAAPHFGFQSSHNLNWEGEGLELEIFSTVRKPLLSLAIQEDWTLTT